MEFRRAENRFGRYCIPASTEWRPAARYTLEGRVWEARTLAFIRRHAMGGDIIHAGTFFGDFLPALSKVAARVWAFEPNPENYAAAAATCEENRVNNVVLRQAALGDKLGTAKLEVSRDGRALGGSSRVVNDLPGAVEVPVLRIDDAVPRDRRVRILHLDVEGYEEQALLGAIETIKAWRPILILETVPADFCRSVLFPLNYRNRGQVDENTVFSIPWVWTGNRYLAAAARRLRSLLGGRPFASYDDPPVPS